MRRIAHARFRAFFSHPPKPAWTTSGAVAWSHAFTVNSWWRALEGAHGFGIPKRAPVITTEMCALSGAAQTITPQTCALVWHRVPSRTHELDVRERGLNFTRFASQFSGLGSACCASVHMNLIHLSGAAADCTHELDVLLVCCRSRPYP